MFCAPLKTHVHTPACFVATVSHRVRNSEQHGHCPVLTDASQCGSIFVCRGTLVGYKHCNIDTTWRRTLTPKHTNACSHTRASATHSGLTLVSTHLVHITVISLNGSMGARPAQQKEAHIQHIWFHCKAHAYTHVHAVTTVTYVHRLRETLHYEHNKSQKSYKAFQKLHFRSFKWWKTVMGLS